MYNLGHFLLDNNNIEVIPDFKDHELDNIRLFAFAGNPLKSRKVPPALHNLYNKMTGSFDRSYDGHFV
jgi:hypothetical protein